MFALALSRKTLSPLSSRKPALRKRAALTTLASLAGCLALASSLSAQHTPRPRPGAPKPPAPNAATSAPLEQPPAPGAPKPFLVPQRQLLQLPNGMRASLAPFGTAPLVAIELRVQAGNINESPEQDALADLMGALMQEGSAGKTSQQIAESFAAMGGTLFFNVGQEYTVASVQVLSEFAPQAIALLADVMRRPNFPASEVERLRADMLRNAAMARTRPGALAEEALAKAIFPANHPFSRGVIPNEAQVKRHTLEDIKAFYAANFGAARASLYVVGKLDQDAALRSAITQAFADWPAGPPPVRNVPALKAERQVVFVERPKSEQAVVRFAVPVPLHPPDQDYIPFQVLNSLLGGSFISRITQNIREEKGYTYSPSSSIRTNYRTALWAHNSDLINKYAEAGIKEITKEIKGLRAEAPPADELERIKAESAGMFVLRTGSLNGIISQLTFLDRHALPDGYLTTYLDRLRAVKREDLQRLAEVYLDPAKMTYVVVGDSTRIQPALDFLKNPQP